MESAIEFLRTLGDLGIKLAVEDDGLSCYAPPGTLTKEIRKGIAMNRNQIIKLLSQRAVARRAAAMAPPTPAKPREFPLSAGEKGLYVLQKLSPESSAYNVPLCLRICGRLDGGALQQAWDHVQDRYPILTARIVERECEPFHCLDEECRTAIVYRDLDAYLPRAEMLAVLEAAAKVPFDLNTGPLTRIDLYMQGPQESILLLTVHHMIFDGTSAVLLLKALFADYQQLCEGRRLDGVESPSGYHEFVAAEGAMLTSPEGEAHAHYWQQQLAGELPTLRIIPDVRCAAAADGAGRTLIEDLPDDLSRWVPEFAKRHALSPAAVFMGLFQLVMHRFTAQSDVIVGMPVMGRTEAKFADEIGYFINMVPIRTRFGERQQCIEFIRDLQGTMLEAFYHASYPFPLMLDRGKTRSDKNPVFNVSFAYQNFIDHEQLAPLLQRHPLAIEAVPEIVQEDDADFGLEIYEKQGSYSLHWKYDPGLYTASAVKRVSESLCTVLRAVSEDPNRFLHEYSITTPLDCRRTLIDYNDTHADYPQKKCIHDLFAEQAAANPDKIAVAAGEHQLSYSELYARSRDLALYLQWMGLEPDGIVGLCMERSLDMIVGLMAILMAGGAYVPLDPDYPDDRLTYMLKDSQVSIVLAQETTHARLAAVAGAGTELLSIDEQRTQIEAFVQQLKAKNVQLHRQVKPHHLAYVTYTSGSTGRPKGVMIEHRSLVNHNTYARRKYQMSAEDVQIQFASMNFDLFAEEVFVVLNSGAQLVLEQKEKLLGLDHLHDVVRKREVTKLNLPTAYFHQLVAGEFDFTGVDCVIVGGEELSHPKAQEFLSKFPTVMLFNTYGPTETTIISAAIRVTRSLLAQHRSVPIGVPIANTAIYILDRNNNCQPPGVPGELHIAGDGLARGYLNQPELTREKFIANPFQPGTRMYRTGDRARWLEDGNIEYLGRMDHQVKVRGFRIETGEIEARLNEHARIAGSVVVVHGHELEKHLVAFYCENEPVDAHGADRVEEELREHLEKTLPGYMVPTAFVRIAALPLTPNGKVDRRALENTRVAIQSGLNYAPPRSLTEKRLVEIWSEVLDLDPGKVGVRDNFFRLGGHSLVATRVISRMRQLLEINLPLKVLFEADSLGDIAEIVDAIKFQNGKAESAEADALEYDEVSL